MGYKVFQSIMVTLLLLCQSVFAGEAPESPLKWMTCFYASGPMGLINNDIMSLERHRLRPDITYLMLFGGSKEPGVGVLQQAGYPNQDILYLQPDGWYPTGYNLHNPPMGESKTMEDFLNISNVLPAEKKCLVIWGHGGGSLVGSPLDEVKNKALDLNGLGEALSKVYVPDIDNPPIDLVIYNSCFMSTLENANVLKGYVKYMVASSEYVPFFGFNYDYFNTIINENPDISALELAKLIAQQYSNNGNNSKTVTATVVDISQIDKVNTAYRSFLAELNAHAADEYSVEQMRRYAYYADHYGAGNIMIKNQYDMVDLYDLAYQLRDFAPNTYEGVMQAIDEVQPFYFLGQNHSYGSTLSVYFPRSGLKENAKTYSKLHVAEAEAIKLADRLLGIKDNIARLKNHPVTKEDNVVSAKLAKDEINELVMLAGRLNFIGKDGKLYFLGDDVRIDADWETGEAAYDLPDTWFSLEGHLLPSYIADIREDSTIFACPVVVNGQEGILCYRIDDDKDGVELIGLTENLSYACYNQENMYPLMPGAVVTTRIIERDEKATLHAYETFTIKGQPTIEDMPLPAKNYKVCINFVSSNHNNAESAFVDLDIR